MHFVQKLGLSPVEAGALIATAKLINIPTQVRNIFIWCLCSFPCEMKSVTLPRQARVKHKLERFACRHNDCGSQVATGIFESYLKMRGVSGVRICQVSTKRKISLWRDAIVLSCK